MNNRPITDRFRFCNNKGEWSEYFHLSDDFENINKFIMENNIIAVQQEFTMSLEEFIEILKEARKQLG